MADLGDGQRQTCNACDSRKHASGIVLLICRIRTEMQLERKLYKMSAVW